MTTIQIIELVFGCVATWGLGIGVTLYACRSYRHATDDGSAVALWAMGATLVWPMLLPGLLSYQACASVAEKEVKLLGPPTCRVISERKGK